MTCPNPLTADDVTLCNRVLNDLVLLAEQVATDARGNTAGMDDAQKALHDVNVVLAFTERRAPSAPALLAVAVRRLARKAAGNA